MIKAAGIAGALLFLIGAILLMRLREPRIPSGSLVLLGVGLAMMAWSSAWWAEASRVDLQEGGRMPADRSSSVPARSD